MALHTIRCLAAVYNDQGKLDEAVDICKRALVGFENVLGPDHSSTLRTVFILGRLYRKWDKMSEAEALYQRVLSGFEKILGPDHSWTRDAIYKLSTLYKNQDRLEEAETLFRQALAGYMNPESKYTLNATDGLGIILKRRGKLGEAEIMPHEALSGRKVALSADHQLTKATAKELSEVYQEQGRLEEAEAMMPSNLTSMVEQGCSHAVAESPIVAWAIHRLCFFSYIQSVHHVPSNPKIEDLPHYLPQPHKPPKRHYQLVQDQGLVQHHSIPKASQDTHTYTPLLPTLLKPWKMGKWANISTIHRKLSPLFLINEFHGHITVH